MSLWGRFSKYFPIRLISSFVFLLTLLSSGMNASFAGLSLTATTHYSGKGFEKFLYSFPLPVTGVTVTRLSGSVTLNNLENVYTEALISVYSMPTGACPTNGVSFATYPEIFAAFPKLKALKGFIVKAPQIGTSQISVDIPFPVGMEMSGCAVMIFDGGAPTTNAQIQMGSDLVLDYTTAPAPNPPAYTLGSGSEFCFGQNFGCEGSTSTAGLSFAYAVPVPRDSTLLALLGDISDSTFDGSAKYGAPPVGNWDFITDFYYLPDGCAAFPQQNVVNKRETAADYYSMLPSNAELLNHVDLSGNGKTALQTSVYQPLSRAVTAGSCILALVIMEGSGGVDAENQVSYLLQPNASSPNNP